MQFKDLKIIDPILKALNTKGYTTPTAIQEKAIPQVLQGKDMLGIAQTGTGKTAAFAIPIIQQINQKVKDFNRKPQIRSLIITPTRELAIQIDDNIKAYARHTNVKHAVIFGGVKQGQQVSHLQKGVHILTATPGRLLDLIQQGIISLDTIKIFVLDEADRMLDMGFIHDIKKLLKILPSKRQSLFFSATMPDNITKLASEILHNPVRIEATPVSSTADTVDQYVYYTNRTLKNDLLHHILEEKQIKQALVFTRTKHGADRVARRLNKSKIKAASLHGDKAQNQRQRALKGFKDQKLQVLVATDIAARGIDIDQLEYVINYEVPNLPETYVHRIGRSGRAGKTGIAITICEPEENAYIKRIQKVIGNKIKDSSDHPFPQTDKPMTPEEKKEWEKEKERRKQEFLANRRKNKKNSPKKNTAQKKQASKPIDQNKKSTKPKQKSKKKVDLGGKMQGSRYAGMSDKLKSKFMWPLE